MSKKGILVAVAALLLACMMTGCGSEDEDTLKIEAYVVESQTIPAIPMEDGVSVEATSATTYGYVGLKDAGATVGSYVELLTAEENGFFVVDSNYKGTDAPDFTKENGSVSLAKNIEEQENQMVSVQLYWATGICTVSTDVLEGSASVSGSGTGVGEDGLTHAEVADVIAGMSPSVFGLGGNSMSDYHVYIRNGLTRVNQENCIWAEVYTDDNPAHTNQYLGTYYLSQDGRRLYILNREDNTVQQVDL